MTQNFRKDPEQSYGRQIITATYTDVRPESYTETEVICSNESIDRDLQIFLLAQ